MKIVVINSFDRQPVRDPVTQLFVRNVELVPRKGDVYANDFGGLTGIVHRVIIQPTPPYVKSLVSTRDDYLDAVVLVDFYY